MWNYCVTYCNHHFEIATANMLLWSYCIMRRRFGGMCPLGFWNVPPPPVALMCFCESGAIKTLQNLCVDEAPKGCNWRLRGAPMRDSDGRGSAKSMQGTRSGVQVDVYGEPQPPTPGYSPHSYLHSVHHVTTSTSHGVPFVFAWMTAAEGSVGRANMFIELQCFSEKRHDRFSVLPSGRICY